jgi:hypothetical protein
VKSIESTAIALDYAPDAAQYSSLCFEVLNDSSLSKPGASEAEPPAITSW